MKKIMTLQNNALSMKKVFIAIAFTASVAISTLSAGLASADPATLSFGSIPSVQVGETVQAEILMNTNGSDVIGLSTVVSYDTNLLDFSGDTFNDMSKAALVDANGTITIDAFSTPDSGIPNGSNISVAVLEFTALQSGSGSLGFSGTSEINAQVDDGNGGFTTNEIFDSSATTSGAFSVLSATSTSGNGSTDNTNTGSTGNSVTNQKDVVATNDALPTTGLSLTGVGIAMLVVAAMIALFKTGHLVGMRQAQTAGVTPSAASRISSAKGGKTKTINPKETLDQIEKKYSNRKK